jgi:hypothetical protein
MEVTLLHEVTRQSDSHAVRSLRRWVQTTSVITRSLQKLVFSTWYISWTWPRNPYVPNGSEVSEVPLPKPPRTKRFQQDGITWTYAWFLQASWKLPHPCGASMQKRTWKRATHDSRSDPACLPHDMEEVCADQLPPDVVGDFVETTTESGLLNYSHNGWNAERWKLPIPQRTI